MYLLTHAELDSNIYDDQQLREDEKEIQDDVSDLEDGYYY